MGMPRLSNTLYWKYLRRRIIISIHVNRDGTSDFSFSISSPRVMNLPLLSQFLKYCFALWRSVNVLLLCMLTVKIRKVIRKVVVYKASHACLITTSLRMFSNFTSAKTFLSLASRIPLTFPDWGNFCVTQLLRY